MEKCAGFGGKTSRLKLKKHALPAIEAVLREVCMYEVCVIRNGREPGPITLVRRPVRSGAFLGGIFSAFFGLFLVSYLVY